MDVDPDTFIPSETVVTAWEAAVGEVQDLRAQVTVDAAAAAEDRVAAGVSAFNAAGSAAVAQSSEEDAVVAASAAMGSAGSAAGSAGAASDAADAAGEALADLVAQKGAPSGVASLDAGGVVPVGQVPVQAIADSTELKSTIDAVAIENESPLNQQSPNPFPREYLAYSKAGRTGTSGRAPVALRFDDWQDDILADGILGHLASRGLFGSIVLCSELGSNPWNQVVTWDNLRSWNRVSGMEFWSHGTDHNNPSPDGYAGLVREIVTSKSDIEAQGIRCMGWAAPGVADPGYGAPVIGDMTDWNTPTGRLLTATYGVVETDMTGAFRHLPGDLRYGLGHATISDGMTLQEAKDLLDGAIAFGHGIEFMSHVGNLDQVGKTTTANWLAILDYIVTKRDAGLVEVVMPSTLPFCDPGSTKRLDLIGNGDFTAAIPVSTSAIGNWRNMDGTNRIVIDVTDGPTGTPAKVYSARSSSFTQQVVSSMVGSGLAGQTLILDAWVRCEPVNGVEVATARFLAADSVTPANMNMDLLIPVTLAWKRLRIPFTPPPVTNAMALSFGRGSPTGSGRVQWGDVHVRIA